MNELTKEQKEQADVYYQKWLKIGQRTDKINKKEAFEIIDKFYEKLKKKKPLKFLFDSPLSCLMGAYFIRKIKYNYLKPRKHNLLNCNINYNIKDEILNMSFRIEPESKSIKKTYLEVKSTILASIEGINIEVAKIMSNEIDNLFKYYSEDYLKEEMYSVKDLLDAFWVGNHNSNWVGYYQFYQNTFNFKTIDDDMLDILVQLTKKTHWIIPTEDVCLISDFPIVFHGVHKDGAPCISYSDKLSIWALNGIQVPKYIAETPSKELNPEHYLGIESINIKAEFIKKFGIDKLIKLGEVIEDIKKNINIDIENIGFYSKSFGEIFYKLRNCSK